MSTNIYTDEMDPYEVWCDYCEAMLKDETGVIVLPTYMPLIGRGPEA